MSAFFHFLLMAVPSWVTNSGFNPCSYQIRDLMFEKLYTLLMNLGGPGWMRIINSLLFIITKNYYITVAKGEHGHPTGTRTRVYRVPNMHSDRHTKEPGLMAWQPESIFMCSDDHIVTDSLVGITDRFLSSDLRGLAGVYC